MNKKGIMGMIMFVLILFVILFLGFVIVVGSSIINWTFDVAVPELTNLGQVGDANMSQIAQTTITPVNNIVQSFTWLSGVLYVLALIGSIGFAVVIRSSPNKWLIGFYFMLIIILILGSILISNMYEEFYTDTGDLGNRLKEHTILSYMILYAPMIFTIIAFVTGIILFSGIQQEEYV